MWCKISAMYSSKAPVKLQSCERVRLKQTGGRAWLYILNSILLRRLVSMEALYREKSDGGKKWRLAGKHS